MSVNPLSLPSYNSTSIFNSIPTPTSLGFIPGVNRALPFGYNPMLNPMFALAQTLGPSLAQFLALLPSLFGGNKNGSSAAASNANSGSQATQQWKDKGGCGGSCGSQGGQNQNAQRSQDPSPARDRSESLETQQDSSRSTRTPKEGADNNDHAGHDH